MRRPLYYVYFMHIILIEWFHYTILGLFLYCKYCYIYMWKWDFNKQINYKLYMSCNLSQSITETLTMLAPMLGLDQFFTVRSHDIVTLILLSYKTISSQNMRYTSFMPASENDHSNFRIYNLCLPMHWLWSKEGLQKLIINISSRIIFNFKWLFLDQLNLIWISYSFVFTEGNNKHFGSFPFPPHLHVYIWRVDITILLRNIIGCSFKQH